MLTVLSCGACCRITSAPSPFALALPLVAASCPARKATAARAVAIVEQIGFMFDVLSFFRYDRMAILNMKHHEGQRLTGIRIDGSPDPAAGWYRPPTARGCR